MDSLRRRVLARDAKNNSARQMEVTARPTETRLICIDCRRPLDLAPLERAMHGTYWQSQPCRHCGGKLVGITW